jgi:parvulin-like peptidyl-prolyl isomerase
MKSQAFSRRAALMLAIVMAVCVPRGAGAAESPPEKAPKLPFSTSLSLFSGRVVAKGNGVEVKQGQIDDMYVSFKANQAALGRTVPETMRAKIEADILDKLIATQLIVGRAIEEDKVKAKEIGEQFVAEQMKQAPSEESFNRQLLAMGMKPEVFRAQIAEQAVVKAVIDREIKSKKTVSDADVKSFYEKNPQYFQEPELVRASHILFSTRDLAAERELTEEQKREKRKLAEKVLVRAKAGNDFKALVKEFSDDQPSKERGGEYIIAHAQEDSSRAVVPEFEGAAFSLATNQISDIVTTKYGYHIIKSLEKIPPKKKELAKVEPQIRETLLQEEVQKELPAYIEKLKKDARVQIVGAENKK